MNLAKDLKGTDPVAALNHPENIKIVRTRRTPKALATPATEISECKGPTPPNKKICYQTQASITGIQLQILDAAINKNTIM